MDLSNEEIITDRLKLIPLTKKFAPDLFREFTPNITTLMFPRSPSEIQETFDYIESQIPKIISGEEMPVIILNKFTGEFLGCGGAHKLKTGKPELGIWIKQSAHGNKYGLEAVVGLKKWIDKNIAYEYIVYPVDRRNIPSSKIAEFLGGKVEVEYKKLNQTGEELDLKEYRIYKNKSK